MNGQFEAALRGRKFKRFVEHTFDVIREKYGLRQIEIDLLLYLWNEPGATASEISRVLELNKGQVSQSFDRLVKEGYLEIGTDPSDRRYNTYSMTEKSKTMIGHAESIRKCASEKIFNGISKEELACAERVYSKVLENIEHLMAEAHCSKTDNN